jgi:hypothetical protein
MTVSDEHFAHLILVGSVSTKTPDPFDSLDPFDSPDGAAAQKIRRSKRCALGWLN